MFLFTIEGMDGSGKETQSKLLLEKIKEKYPDKKVVRLSFPNYESDSSILVREYLQNKEKKFRNSQILLYFAIDRAITMTKYKDYDIIIADRYVDSNVFYHGDDDITVHYIMDLEYDILGIPKPNKSVYLDVPYEFSEKLRENRKNKISNKDELDRHESDTVFMKKVYNNIKRIFETHTELYDDVYDHIQCVISDNLRSIEEINNDVLLSFIDSYNKYTESENNNE